MGVIFDIETGKDKQKLSFTTKEEALKWIRNFEKESWKNHSRNRIVGVTFGPIGEKYRITDFSCYFDRLFITSTVESVTLHRVDIDGVNDDGETYFSQLYDALRESLVCLKTLCFINCRSLNDASLELFEKILLSQKLCLKNLTLKRSFNFDQKWFKRLVSILEGTKIEVLHLVDVLYESCNILIEFVEKTPTISEIGLDIYSSADLFLLFDLCLKRPNISSVKVSLFGEYDYSAVIDTTSLNAVISENKIKVLDLDCGSKHLHQSFWNVLSRNTSLTELTFRSMKVDIDFLKDFQNFVTHNNNLKSLLFSSCPVVEVCGSRFFDSLSSSKSLKNIGVFEDNVYKHFYNDGMNNLLFRTQAKNVSLGLNFSSPLPDVSTIFPSNGSLLKIQLASWTYSSYENQRCHVKCKEATLFVICLLRKHRKILPKDLIVLLAKSFFETRSDNKSW